MQTESLLHRVDEKTKATEERATSATMYAIQAIDEFKDLKAFMDDATEVGVDAY